MCFWKYFFRSPQSCLNSNDIFCLFLNNQVESSHKISQKMCWAFVKLQVLSACQPSSLWRPCGRLPPVFCICWIRSRGCLMTSTNVGWEKGWWLWVSRWEMNGGCWWTMDERERERAWMQHLKRHDIHPSHLIHLQKKPCTTWKTLISWYGCHLSISEYRFTILSPDWLSSYHGPRLTSSSSYKGRASGIGILPKYCQSWVKRCWCSSCGTKVWHQRCKVSGIGAVDMGRACGDMGSQYSEEKRTFWLDVRWTLNTPTRNACFWMASCTGRNWMKRTTPKRTWSFWDCCRDGGSSSILIWQSWFIRISDEYQMIWNPWLLLSSTFMKLYFLPSFGSCSAKRASTCPTWQQVRTMGFGKISMQWTKILGFPLGHGGWL